MPVVTPIGKPSDVEQNDAELAARLRISLARLTRLSRRTSQTADLSLSQLSVLAAVQANPRIRIGDLAATEALMPPSATRIVQTLADRGLLDRDTDPVDKRACMVTITAAGEKSLTEIRAHTTDLISIRLVGLCRSDRAKLHQSIDALERLTGGLDRPTSCDEDRGAS